MAIAVVVLLAALLGGHASPALAEKSAIEAYLNPFGDEWRLAAGNPDIPLMAPFPCPRALPEQFWDIPPEQHAFVADLAAPLCGAAART